MMRLLIIVLDGVPDRPLKELGGNTPLESAHTPNMDEIARNGICGLMDPIAPGIRPGSDVAHLALLGYDPYVYYTGRGAFEAAGSGIEVHPEDVVFRCNFATVNENLVIVDRRAGREEEGLEDLALSLDDMKMRYAPDVKVIFKRTTGHRAVLILRGRGLSRMVSDVDPRRIGIKPLDAKPLELTQEAKITSEIVNEFTKRSYEILMAHEANQRRVKMGKLPANIVISRGAGIAPKMETLKERYGIDTSACIAEVALVKGVAYYAGMKIVDVPGLTGNVDTNTDAIGRTAFKLLEENEFVFINVKGPDVAGHDGDIDNKIKIIEKIDHMVGYIWDKIDREESILVITSDHSTPISVRDHSGDPTPLVIAGPAVRADDVDSFGERSVARGGLGRIRALSLMPILLDLMGKSKKFGA